MNAIRTWIHYKFTAAVFFVFAFAAVVFGAGAPCRAGMFDVDDAKEANMGKEVADEVIRQYGVVDDEAERDRLLNVSKALVKASGRPNIEYHFYIANTDMVNAFALPGGYIFVTRGLMDYIEDDDELAAVLGHELTHVALRHGVVEYKKSLRDMMVNFLLLLATRDPNVLIGAQMYQQGRYEIFGRRAEIDADKYGLEYCVKAGYDPQGDLRFMEKMLKLEQHRPALFEGYFDVHPDTADRIATIKNKLKEMNISADLNSGDKFQSRVFAREDCIEAKCKAIIMCGENEVISITDTGGYNSAYDRAQDATLAFNSMLDNGVKVYDIKTMPAGDDPGVFIKDQLIVKSLDGDAAAAGVSKQQLADDWVRKIKNMIWSGLLKDGY